MIINLITNSMPRPTNVKKEGWYLLSTYEPLSKHERWRKQAKLLKLSREAQKRLEWFIYYETKAEHNASLTARHFGIARKSFHKWYSLFEEKDFHTLEDRSRAPKHVRQREIAPEEERRIIELRTKHMQWGKVKIARLYKNTYGTTISSWKVQYTIKQHNLYPNPKKNKQTQAKRQRTQVKKRTINLRKKSRPGFIIALDTIVLHWQSKKRYVLTAIDEVSKIAFARMYTTKHSRNAADFIKRMAYLLDYELWNTCHDNGSEFEGLFQEVLTELNLGDYWSRTATPKDNSINERFNRTIQEEFIDLGNMTDDTISFNHMLTDWLIEYNFVRPHQSLDYDTPWEYYADTAGVLPMYSSSTLH